MGSVGDNDLRSFALNQAPGAFDGLFIQVAEDFQSIGGDSADCAERRRNMQPRHARAGDAYAHAVFQDVAADRHLDAEIGFHPVEAAVGVQDFGRLGYGQRHRDGFGTAQGGLHFPVYQRDDLLFPCVHFFFLSLMYSRDLWRMASSILESLSTSSGNPKLTTLYPSASYATAAGMPLSE